MGFEPTTASLEGWNSTTELRPPTVTRPTLQRSDGDTLGHNAAHRQIALIIIVQPDAHVSREIRSNTLSLVGRQGFEPWKP